MSLAGVLPENWDSWTLDQKTKYTDELKYNWDLWARPEQREPSGDDWDIWLYIAGRGAGKTRTGAEWVKEKMLSMPGIRVGIIGQTIGSARDICMEGESGLLSVLPPGTVEKYNRTVGQLKLKNGSQAFTFGGTDPERLRGFQSHALWMDELCAWQHAVGTYDMSMMGNRLGNHPRIFISTTPKPTTLIAELIGRASTDPEHVKISTGSTFSNAANLAASTLDALRKRYEGTTLGRQELYAELILEEKDALWRRDTIERNILKDNCRQCQISMMSEIVIGVDPNASQTTERETECGIVVVGRGVDGLGYILADESMLRPSPHEWGTKIAHLYEAWNANSVVAEVNQGYDMVTHTIHTVNPAILVKKVYSMRAKSLRAEPISALSEQDRIKFCGKFTRLEDQMLRWVPGNPSPDRLDAFVHGMTKVMLGGGMAEFFQPGDLPRLPGILG